MSDDPLLESAIVKALKWEEAEKFWTLEGTLRTVAERAMEYKVIAFRLVKADQTEEIEKAAPHYNGSVPILIANARYLCFYLIAKDDEQG